MGNSELMRRNNSSNEFLNHTVSPHDTSFDDALIDINYGYEIPERIIDQNISWTAYRFRYDTDDDTDVTTVVTFLPKNIEEHVKCRLFYDWLKFSWVNETIVLVRYHWKLSTFSPQNRIAKDDWLQLQKPDDSEEEDYVNITGEEWDEKLGERARKKWRRFASVAQNTLSLKAHKIRKKDKKERKITQIAEYKELTRDCVIDMVIELFVLHIEIDVFRRYSCISTVLGLRRDWVLKPNCMNQNYVQFISNTSILHVSNTQNRL